METIDVFFDPAMGKFDKMVGIIKVIKMANPLEVEGLRGQILFLKACIEDLFRILEVIDKTCAILFY